MESNYGYLFSRHGQNSVEYTESGLDTKNFISIMIYCHVCFLLSLESTRIPRGAFIRLKGCSQTLIFLAVYPKLVYPKREFLKKLSTLEGDHIS